MLHILHKRALVTHGLLTSLHLHLLSPLSVSYLIWLPAIPKNRIIEERGLDEKKLGGKDKIKGLQSIY